jgi:hypothetical protein
MTEPMEMHDRIDALIKDDPRKAKEMAAMCLDLMDAFNAGKRAAYDEMVAKFPESSVQCENTVKGAA